MPIPRPQLLVLDDESRQALEALVRRHNAPQQIALRARIVLLAHQGLNHHDIARQLEIGVDMAGLWRARWLEQRHIPPADRSVEARLSDAPRSGAPPTISAEAYCRIMAIACRPPEIFGRPIANWTARELAEEAIHQGIVQTISTRQVGRFLKKCGPPTAPDPLLADAGGGSRQGRQDGGCLQHI